jgi:mono/diheme cytochrome c family protein
MGNQRLCVTAAARLLALGCLASVLFFVHFFGLFFGNPSVSAQQTKPAGNAESGKKLFLSVGCYECHNREGQGGAGTGPRLAPNLLPFSAFIHQLRQPASQMPPYTEKVLSEAQVADIYAFLQSIPKPPAVSSIPLLQGK